MRVDAVKRASLSTMIQRAKDEGVFDEVEAKNGIVRIRKEEESGANDVDDEGNVIADAVRPTPTPGMVPSEPTGSVDGSLDDEKTGSSDTRPADPSAISIHTVSLPPRAPKQLLLDLKDVFLRYPGHEKIRLKIGAQFVELPITIAMSPLLQQRIDEVLKRYENA